MSRLKIPLTQKDIKLSTYLKYIEYTDNLVDKNNVKDVMKNTIMLFYDIDEVKYNSIPATQINSMFQIIDNILKKEQEVVYNFTLNGTEYGLNPDFSSMSFGELIDCNTADILTQICILYRPITNKKKNKYTIKEYEADISMYDEFKENLTLDVYNGFIAFFLRILQGCMNYTLKSLEEREDITQEMKKVLEQNGDGIRSLWNFATMI